jgi:hypothetical protein
MVGGRGGGVKSVDQALQLREHMALRNVIRLEDHMIWGQTAGILAHDERERGRDRQSSGRHRLPVRGVEGIAESGKSQLT